MPPRTKRQHPTPPAPVEVKRQRVKATPPIETETERIREERKDSDDIESQSEEEEEGQVDKTEFDASVIAAAEGVEAAAAEAPSSESSSSDVEDAMVQNGGELVTDKIENDIDSDQDGLQVEGAGVFVSPPPSRSAAHPTKTKSKAKTVSRLSGPTGVRVRPASELMADLDAAYANDVSAESMLVPVAVEYDDHSDDLNRWSTDKINHRMAKLVTLRTKLGAPGTDPQRTVVDEIISKLVQIIASRMFSDGDGDVFSSLADMIGPGPVVAPDALGFLPQLPPGGKAFDTPDEAIQAYCNLAPAHNLHWADIDPKHVTMLEIKKGKELMITSKKTQRMIGDPMAPSCRRLTIMGPPGVVRWVHMYPHGNLDKPGEYGPAGVMTKANFEFSFTDEYYMEGDKLADPETLANPEVARFQALMCKLHAGIVQKVYETATLASDLKNAWSKKNGNKQFESLDQFKEVLCTNHPVIVEKDGAKKLFFSAPVTRFPSKEEDKDMKSGKMKMPTWELQSSWDNPPVRRNPMNDSSNPDGNVLKQVYNDVPMYRCRTKEEIAASAEISTANSAIDPFALVPLAERFVESGDVVVPIFEVAAYLKPSVGIKQVLVGVVWIGKKGCLDLQNAPVTKEDVGKRTFHIPYAMKYEVAGRKQKVTAPPPGYEAMYPEARAAAVEQAEALAAVASTM